VCIFLDDKITRYQKKTVVSCPCTFSEKQGCGSGYRRQKLPTKIEKSKEFSCFEVLGVLF
jgi:hypothetical protein